MKGKIFSESNNIYQDQATILFNYYQQMAEKIVREEERIEKEIVVLEEEKTVLNTDLSKAKMWKWILFILIIPYIYFSFQEKGISKKIASLNNRIDEFKKQHKEIFRDYKINKLGIAYIPVANQIKYENKTFIVDYTGKVEDSVVKLQLSKQNDLLIETISELEKLSAKAPIVESSDEIEEIDTDEYSSSMQHLNQHDYFGKMERSLRTISYCMDDLDITSVELPLIGNDSLYLNRLKEFATNEKPSESPVIEVFDTTKYDSQIAKFQEINKLKDSLSTKTAQFEDVLKELMLTMANSVQAISALKIASADKIVVESNKLLYKILKSPYNHYSPVMEASEIERIKNENFNYSESVTDYVPFQLKESSKVKFNLTSGSWTAEDGSTTSFPFGVHQIHEEIVAPIVQNLMNETRIERLKIYNHIKDQKISYLNKWHQDTEDFYGRNRAESADLINLMRASLRDYIAAYNTLTSLKKTEESMAQSDGSLDATVVKTTDNSAEVLAAFELQSKEFQDVQQEFENYMERLKEDIEIKADKFEHIDYYDALLRDGNSRDTAVAASEVHELDERRKPLITVNPLFAKTSDLPPKPNIEDITFEHISLNLPNIARNTLKELDEEMSDGITEEFDLTEEPVNEMPENELPENEDELTTTYEDDQQEVVTEQKVREEIVEETGNEAEQVEQEEEEEEEEIFEEDDDDDDEANAVANNQTNELDEEVYNWLLSTSEEEIRSLPDDTLVDILALCQILPLAEYDREAAIQLILEQKDLITPSTENN